MSKIRQLDRVYELLQSPSSEGYTRMQIAKCLGIERASVCRRVAELRDANLIWEIRKGIDPVTKERAGFLTGNKAVAMAAQAKPLSREVKVEETGRLF